MFNNVSYAYNDTNKTYTINGRVGYGFKYALAKLGYSIPKQKYLFTKSGPFGFTVHRFFIPDVRALCVRILDSGSVLGTNLVVVSKIINLIDTTIMGKGVTQLHVDMDLIYREFKYKPLPVQEPVYPAYAEIRGLSGSRGMLLDGAIGVGKTYTSLSLSVALRSESVLIVVPKSVVRTVWINSLKGDGCLYKKPQPTHLVGDGDYAGEKYVVVHYENIDKIVPLYKKHRINFSTIIVDEVHNFNDPKALRTRTLMDVIDTIPLEHAIPMSGTPIKSRPRDLIPLLRIINKDFNTRLQTRFTKLYSSRSYNMLLALKSRYDTTTVVLRKEDMTLPTVTTITTKVKIKNHKSYTLDAIRTRVRDYMDKREDELLVDYPKYAATYKRLYLRVKDMLMSTSELKASAFTAYERNIEIIVGSYRSNNLYNIPEQIRDANAFEKKYIEPKLAGVEKSAFREAKTVYKYIRLKVQGEALANIVMRARIDCYGEMALSHDGLAAYINSTVKKTLIFSNYIDVCEVVKTRCIKDGLTPTTVYGDTAKDLTKNVNTFTNRSEVNPLIATYKSLSTGVPLIAANVVVMYGLPHRQYVFDQAIGRVWRTGQDTPVHVYIAELDSGDELNITDRDFDILAFFREEVASLTGNTDAIVIERVPALADELHVSDFLIPRDDYISKLVKGTKDILMSW